MLRLRQICLAASELRPVVDDLKAKLEKWNSALPQDAGAPKEKADSGRPIDPRQLSNSEIKLLQALAQRRTTLDNREESLNQREALLRAAEQKLVDRQTEPLPDFFRLEAITHCVTGLHRKLLALVALRLGQLWVVIAQ